MAQSYSHRFGQIIGEILEDTFTNYFSAFAQEYGLYLDKKGVRLGRKGKKCSWVDEYGNKHDLDFVLERGGSAEAVGTPIAFIESAWRRYTKHSRNKAQEIQGAILPLANTHRYSAPFLGVILAGVFTAGALNQLASRGFKVLYLEYNTVVQAFGKYGIDASFDEDTPEEAFRSKIDAWDSLEDKQSVINTLVELNSKKVSDFLEALRKSVTRYIKEVRILPLFGSSIVLSSIDEAINFLNIDLIDPTQKDFIRYEIKIVYSNGDEIDAKFSDKENAKDFLRDYQSQMINIQEEDE